MSSFPSGPTLPCLNWKEKNHISVYTYLSWQNRSHMWYMQFVCKRWQYESTILTWALRAAACWIWLLLRALLKGSLSSLVFLCTISRGFLNMASSSLTPVPQEKKHESFFSFSPNIIYWLDHSIGDSHSRHTYPLGNTSRHSLPCTPRSQVLL